MFEISIEREFCAAHAIILNGEREPVHGHNWRVTVIIEGPVLNAEGLLCDFHELELGMDDVLTPFMNANLNETPPFDQLNPTAEHVAKHIAVSLQRALPPGVELQRVRVTEAPGCAATYRPSAR